MKPLRYVLIAFLLSNGFSVLSQKAVKVDIRFVNKVVKFPALIKDLEKTDYYKFEMPSSLTYHSAAEIKGFFPYELSAIGIRAKLREDKLQYIFEVQSPGIKNIKELPLRYLKNYTTNVGGFVKDIQYNFPCSLVVKIWDGKDIKVLRKIEIFSKDYVLSGVYDAGNSAPFATQDGLNNAFGVNKYNFLKATERGAMRLAYYKFVQAIDYLFAEFNHGKTGIPIGYLKAKNREYDFAAIDTLTEQYKQALDAFYEVANPQSTSLLAPVAAKYEKLINSTEPMIDKNIKDIAKLNYSYCQVLLGNVARARENVTALKKSTEVGDYYGGLLDQFISLYEFRKQVEESN